MAKEEQYKEDQWEADAPLLASLKHNALGDVPDGYFSGLPDQVMERIRGQEAAGPGEANVSNVPGSSSRTWRPLAMLAGLLLLTAFGLAFLVPWEEPAISEEEMVAVQLELVDEGDILSELELADLSGEELYEMLGQEAQAALGEEMSEFSQDHLFEYLEGADLDAGAWESIELEANFFNEATQ